MSPAEILQSCSDPQGSLPAQNTLRWFKISTFGEQHQEEQQEPSPGGGLELQGLSRSRGGAGKVNEEQNPSPQQQKTWGPSL